MKPPRALRRGASDVVDVAWALGQCLLIIGELLEDLVIHLRAEWRTRHPR